MHYLLKFQVFCLRAMREWCLTVLVFKFNISMTWVNSKFVQLKNFISSYGSSVLKLPAEKLLGIDSVFVLWRCANYFTHQQNNLCAPTLLEFNLNFAIKRADGSVLDLTFLCFMLVHIHYFSEFSTFRLSAILSAPLFYILLA